MLLGDDDMSLINLFVVLLLVYCLFSGWMERTILTAPIIFTTAGMLAYFFAPELRSSSDSAEVFLRVAETGLVLLLFTDASRTDLKVLKSLGQLPVRLLSAGMLLTILLGAVAARLVFPRISFWEAGILSAILAPTDAGLGQIIVNSPRVPMRIRQALNVEAGLNDGLSVPFLLFFLGLAATSPGARRASLLHVAIEQLGYGTLIGVGIGLAGGWLLELAQRKKWMAESLQQLGLVTLPLLCTLASHATGASMFIAAFVAGLAVQARLKDAGKHSIEFAESWGQLFNLSVFFLFGLLGAHNLPLLNLGFLLYAILSLTVVRMLPVAVSLLGTGLSHASVLFMGWFGPRGLASIVLGLVLLESRSHLAGEDTIILAVLVTVLLSIFAHGLTALPGIDFYARQLRGLSPAAPENLAGASGPAAELNASFAHAKD